MTDYQNDPRQELYIDQFGPGLDSLQFDFPPVQKKMKWGSLNSGPEMVVRLAQESLRMPRFINKSPIYSERSSTEFPTLREELP